jgi:hypothetical protein
MSVRSTMVLNTRMSSPGSVCSYANPLPQINSSALRRYMYVVGVLESYSGSLALFTDALTNEI